MHTPNLLYLYVIAIPAISALAMPIDPGTLFLQPNVIATLMFANV